MTDIGQLLMEFGDFLIYFGIGWVISNLVLGLSAFLLRRHIERSLDQELTVEIDHDQYFCYNSITKDFVCQGSDLTEIRKRFRERYPDKDAAIYDGDQTAVAALKSQLQELKKQNENSISI